MEWTAFSSILIGAQISQLRYGRALTQRRMIWNGLGAACFLVPLSALATYFICPFCQVNNLNGLQLVPVEYRFKDYIDKKYNMYENADAIFYEQSVKKEEVNKQMRNRFAAVSDQRVAIMKERVRAALEGNDKEAK